MPEPTPPSLDPDALEHDEEDVLPTLWRRGRAQPAFVAGCVAYGAALAVGSTNLWTWSPVAMVFAILLLLAASVGWGYAQYTHGPVFAEAIPPAASGVRSVLVEWRCESDGRRPGGSARVESDGEEAVFVRGTPYWWDWIAMIGIAGTTSWLVFGPPWRIRLLSSVGFLFALLALERFGLPRRRRVETRIRWQDIARIDLRGSLFTVTAPSHEPLHFVARRAQRMRLARMLRTRLPHRFFEDERMREWHAAPPREPSLADIERRLESVKRAGER